MAAFTPRYLFRCWSDQSNGTNACNLFAPAGLNHPPDNITVEHDQDFISLDDPVTSYTNSDFGNQLHQALLWKKDQTKCPFVFLTTSPIFVVQLAAWRHARKESKDGTVVERDTGINITVIDTQTARTSDGWPVRFQPVRDLLQTHGVELRNRGDGSVREYADHWVATTSVAPGEGSYHACLQDLINNGFYELYSPIEAANDRKDPRPWLTTDDLRKYFFRSAGSTSLSVRESLDTAERVAMCFRPNVANSQYTTQGDGRDVGLVMAFVLSLRKRNLKDLAFKLWLKGHTEDALQDDEDEAIIKASRASDIPDADEFISLSQHFSGLNFRLNGLAFGLSIDLASIEKEKADWAGWWKSNRDQYRATHPREQRQGWRDRRANRPRELLERRARRDSAIGAPVQHHQQQQMVERPRELYPGWRGNNAPYRHRMFDRRPYVAETSGHRRQGYQVLTSRPGDAATTRQQHRHARVSRRRDVDEAYARRLGGRYRSAY